MSPVLVTSAFATTGTQTSLFAIHHGGKRFIMGSRVGVPESFYQWAFSKPYHTEVHLLVSILDPINCQGQRAQPSLLEI